MSQRHLPALFVLAVILLSVSPLSAQKLTKVKVLANVYLGFAPFFIAQEEGFFEEQGLDVEFVRLSTSGQAIPALAHGDVDVVAGVLYAAYFNAIAKGSPIRIVADRGHLDPENCADYAFMIRSDLPYRDPVPKEVLSILNYSANSPTAFNGALFDKLLTRSGAEPGGIHIISLPTPARFAAFASGSIDIAMINEPFVTKFSEAGVARVLTHAGNVAPGFQQAQLFYGPNLLEKDPETGKSFMTAYLRAVRQYNKGKTPRNIAILAKYTKFEEDLLRRSCWPTIRNDGRISVESITAYQEWFHGKGLIDSVIPPDRFWDPRFVDHADRALGSSW